MNNFNETQIRKTLKILKPDNEPFEIRVKYKDKSIYSGYFNDADTCINQLYALPNGENNAYITLNKINSACMSRTQGNHFIKKSDATTSDGDIVGYEWLLIDLDPQRPTDTSSSKDEIDKAKIVGQKVFDFMNVIGFSKPVQAMSGNGYHLLYRINLKNDTENKKLVETILKTLDMLFSDDYVKVDTTVYNPSRICKLYGTVAQKGKHTEDRPHRLSYIIGDYAEVRNTDRGYLTKLCDMYPTKTETAKYNKYNAKDFDIEAWMQKYGLRYKQSSYADGTKYVLEHCPFDSSHKYPDSAIFRSRDGAIGFRCLHNSCNCNTWHDVRVLFEPEAYEKKHKDYEERIYHSYNRDKQKAEPKKIVEKEGQPIFLTALDILNMPKQEETFVKSGIDMIDKKMRGLKKGYVSLWSGLRSSAKSTVLSEIGINAVQDGNNVGFYSGELQPRNFMRWMMLQCAGKSHCEPSQYEGYYNVPIEVQKKIAAWLGEHFFLYNNEYGHEFLAIKEKLEEIIQKKNLDLLILDNLMSFNIKALSDNKWDAQTEFIFALQGLAKKYNVHICIVAHPRKAMGFLRLNDISGSADLGNAVDDAFIVHRNNNDFRRLTKEMFQWTDDNALYQSTNVIEITKDRDGGQQDTFIPLWYELETKRLKNSQHENIVYGWDENNDGFEQINFENPFEEL